MRTRAASYAEFGRHFALERLEASRLIIVEIFGFLRPVTVSTSGVYYVTVLRPHFFHIFGDGDVGYAEQQSL